MNDNETSDLDSTFEYQDADTSTSACAVLIVISPPNVTLGGPTRSPMESPLTKKATCECDIRQLWNGEPHDKDCPLHDGA